jgi:hypothetical protein
MAACGMKHRASDRTDPAGIMTRSAAAPAWTWPSTRKPPPTTGTSTGRVAEGLVAHRDGDERRARGCVVDGQHVVAMRDRGLRVLVVVEAVRDGVVAAAQHVDGVVALAPGDQVVPAVMGGAGEEEISVETLPRTQSSPPSAVMTTLTRPSSSAE